MTIVRKMRNPDYLKNVAIKLEKHGKDSLDQNQDIAITCN